MSFSFLSTHTHTKPLLNTKAMGVTVNEVRREPRTSCRKDEVERAEELSKALDVAKRKSGAK